MIDDLFVLITSLQVQIGSFSFLPSEKLTSKLGNFTVTIARIITLFARPICRNVANNSIIHLPKILIQEKERETDISDNECLHQPTNIANYFEINLVEAN